MTILQNEDDFREDFDSWRQSSDISTDTEDFQEDFKGHEDHRIAIEDNIAILDQRSQISQISNDHQQNDPIFKRCGIFCMGLSLAFVSGIIFSANSFLVQAYKLDFAETLLVRSIIQIIVIGALVQANGFSFWPTVGDHPNRIRALVIFQGVWGALMIICSFSCVLFLPLGDALTLIFSAPLSTMVMAAIFLGHSLRLYKITLGAVLLTGTVLVVRPPFLFNVSFHFFPYLLKIALC